MTIAEYLSNLNKLLRTGQAREHSYRGDLQALLSTLLPDILVTNEPARVSCGAPDYMLSRKGVPVGYVEAKDIGVDLNSKSLKEQFDRYRSKWYGRSTRNSKGSRESRPGMPPNILSPG